MVSFGDERFSPVVENGATYSVCLADRLDGPSESRGGTHEYTTPSSDEDSTTSKHWSGESCGGNIIKI